MPAAKTKNQERPQQKKLTVWVSLEAYVALTDIQRHHLITVGERRTIQNIVEAAILSYAKEKETQATQ